MTVNALAPALIEGGGTLPGRGQDDKEAHKKLAARVPVGRLGRPEEVAQAMCSLVANPFITSQTVSVAAVCTPAEGSKIRASVTVIRHVLGSPSGGRSRTRLGW